MSSTMRRVHAGLPRGRRPSGWFAALWIGVACFDRGAVALADGLADEDRTAAFTCGCLPWRSTRAPAVAAVAPPSAQGEKRLLIYRVDFSDAPGAALEASVAAELVTGLGQFYREMSYGRMTIALVSSGSVVTETLRLPEVSTAYDNRFEKLIGATREAAAAAGYAPETYDFDVVCTGAKPWLVFGAMAYVGGPGIWIGNNNFNVGVLGHELGHNLGLPHASFWDTGDQSTVGPGTTIEYGDPFDSMGVPGGSTSHFNAAFKHQLGWLTDADAPWAESDGTYRLAAHDDPEARGVRALRVGRPAGPTLWVEFRRSFNNRWVTNGATLRWYGGAATNSLLLDATPGTPSGKQDGAVLLGRTYNDPCAGLYLTPVARSETAPTSLEVVVRRGPTNANRPPTLEVAADSTTVLPGAPVTLTATASDPDGDPVAYGWDFGNDQFGPNQATVSYAWPRDGEYVVRCAVSDLKGGLAAQSLRVRVGQVSTWAASGRVLRRGTPVVGALVKAGSRYTYTDSAGDFLLSRLASGRHTFTAQAEGLQMVNAGFDNPVEVGAAVSGLAFEALPLRLPSFTLVARGAEWRYLDAEPPPEEGWTGLEYDDASWATGRAKLGYGVGDEATTVKPGPPEGPRRTTTWFRHTFEVEAAEVVDHLLVGLRRDDGAVVYLNGHELYRENLPDGSIEPGTRARADVNSTEEGTWFRRHCSAGRLRTGTNVLAVEVHQVDPASPDLAFDLELVAVSEAATSFVPRLGVAREGTDVLLRWPSGHVDWSVETADELGTGNGWQPASGAPERIGVEWWWRIVPVGEGGFYRLHRVDWCGPWPGPSPHLSYPF